MKKKRKTEARRQNFADLFKCPHHLFFAVVGYVVNREMTENIKQMATEKKAKGDLKLGYAYLNEKSRRLVAD
ncbi:hypothetical protein BsIDN1_06300 [Bacillus safensis]|uniref:Uncharacterized protein n=1 Tax=Bacillus safensis TaxID=561879 RepID=A0A5S9M2Q5_BACIA|nr:hypothetical protein BsIDN1_06300 [Bacillus safensis]